MHRTILALDVGGTHSRAWFGEVAEDRPASDESDGPREGGTRDAPRPLGEPMRREVADTASLQGFVREVLDAAPTAPDAVGAAFAGPVDGDAVRMVNWEGDAQVSEADLAAAGLPTGRIRMMNDLVAGAFGVIALASTDSPHLVRLRGGDPFSRSGSHLFVAPGTGLGAATLVHHGAGDPRHGANAARTLAPYTPSACEAQHTPAPALSGDQELMSALAASYGRPATWEEISSGKGLPGVYAALRGIERPEAPDAARIAEAALSGDPGSVEAFDVFYRYAAAFCQAVALSHLPCSGVHIGGSSTVRNRSLIERGVFEAAFDRNPVMSRLLTDIPLTLVLDEDVNLRGALAAAAQV